MRHKWMKGVRIAAALSLSVVLSSSQTIRAEIRGADLTAIRSVSEGDWLRLKLSVLGCGSVIPPTALT